MNLLLKIVATLASALTLYACCKAYLPVSIHAIPWQAASSGKPGLESQRNHTIRLPNSAILNRFHPGDKVTEDAEKYQDYYFDGPGAENAPIWARGALAEQLAARGKLLTDFGFQPHEPFTFVYTGQVTTVSRVDCNSLSTCTSGVGCSCMLVNLPDVPLSAKAAKFARVTSSTTTYHQGHMVPGANQYLLRDATQLTAPFTIDLGDAPLLARPALSFVHLSDVQLREASAKLGAADMSATFDKAISSFERDPDEERFVVYVFAALLRTIDSEYENFYISNPGERPPGTVPGRIGPEFIIHTGDAIDAGLEREMTAFHTMLDALEIPWVDVVGNHDVLTFGNFRPGTCVSVNVMLDAAPASIRGTLKSILPGLVKGLCLKPGNEAIVYPDGEAGNERLVAAAPDPLQRFVELHGHEAPRPAEHLWSGTPYEVKTENHGFDQHRGGYYAFSRPLDLGDGVQRKAVFAVLQLNELTGGAAGNIDQAQLNWLNGVVTGVAPTDLVFVFAHHPLSTIVGDNKVQLCTLLESSRNVIAFIAGHTHDHAVRSHKPCGVAQPANPFWEIETGSIISFPQEARLITIKNVGPNLGFIEAIPFGHAVKNDGSTFAKNVERGVTGAKADICTNHPENCVRGEPKPANEADAAVRLFFRIPR